MRRRRVAGSRAPLRLACVALALLRWGWLRSRPPSPQRILVLHHLLLGDTLMVTALLAKLREQFPAADIVMTVARAMVPLYAGRPYGVTAQVLDPRDVATLWPLLEAKRFDLAILPADNRWSWLARAIGARWIVGFAEDRPAHKNWPVDEVVAYSRVPTAFVETAGELVQGAAPRAYRPRDWPAPVVERRLEFAAPYAVLHVGASSPLKLWAPAKWRELAAWLEARDLTVVWSVGPGESALLEAIDADLRRPRIDGTLSLPELRNVLEKARLLVCPDTGIAHLGRIAGVPTVTLFGSGSPVIVGPGKFFAEVPSGVVTIENFPCRDQTIQFFREVPWAQRCERLFGDGPDQCPQARCMEAIEVSSVTAAIENLHVFATKDTAKG